MVIIIKVKHTVNNAKPGIIWTIPKHITILYHNIYIHINA